MVKSLSDKEISLNMNHRLSQLSYQKPGVILQANRRITPKAIQITSELLSLPQAQSARVWEWVWAVRGA